MTNIRESIVDIYGNQNQKKANEVYSSAISVLKNMKNSFGGKGADLYLYKAIALLGADVMRLQVQNTITAYRIKSLDINAYYQLVEPWKIHYGSGGGGAGSGW